MQSGVITLNASVKAAKGYIVEIELNFIKLTENHHKGGRGGRKWQRQNGTNLFLRLHWAKCAVPALLSTSGLSTIFTINFNYLQLLLFLNYLFSMITILEYFKFRGSRKKSAFLENFTLLLHKHCFCKLNMLLKLRVFRNNIRRILSTLQNMGGQCWRDLNLK